MKIQFDSKTSVSLFSPDLRTQNEIERKNLKSSLISLQENKTENSGCCFIRIWQWIASLFLTIFSCGKGSKNESTEETSISSSVDSQNRQETDSEGELPIDQLDSETEIKKQSYSDIQPDSFVPEDDLVDSYRKDNADDVLSIGSELKEIGESIGDNSPFKPKRFVQACISGNLTSAEQMIPRIPEEKRSAALSAALIDTCGLANTEIHQKVVRFLLAQKDTNINFEDEMGLTALYSLCSSINTTYEDTHIAILKMLLDANANPNQPLSTSRLYPIESTTNLKAIEMLLNRGANPLIKEKGKTLIQRIQDKMKKTKGSNKEDLKLVIDLLTRQSKKQPAVKNLFG